MRVTTTTAQTSAGLIMIDTLYDTFTEHAVKSIEQLGLNPKDVKYIIVTHGHNDHVGGAKSVQAFTGARLVMAEGDWVMSKLPRDMVVKDGDQIKLGDRTGDLLLKADGALSLILKSGVATSLGAITNVGEMAGDSATVSFQRSASSQQLQQP